MSCYVFGVCEDSVTPLWNELWPVFQIVYTI